MAGMFYSLKQTASKLGVTEQEVRQMVKEGRLREFRDGPNLLFKIDEVEALAKELTSKASQPQGGPSDEQLVLEQEQPSEGLGPEELESLFASEGSEEVPTAGPEEQQQTLEQVGQEELLLAGPQGQQEGSEGPQSEDLESLFAADQQEVPKGQGEAAEGAVPELSDTLGVPSPEGSSEEVLLAPESGATTAAKDQTALDTTLTGEGVSVLGPSDEGYKLTDDTLAETMAGLGSSEEASLEEIEKDVNLDTFGSGSGLLDLSLQADDTSLGGVLDEIYTPEGQKEAEPGQGSGAIAAEVAAETEQIPPSPELGIPGIAQVPGSVSLAVPVGPDPAEGLISGLLGISLLVAAYTLVATVSVHMFKATPGLVVVTKQFIVYAIGGLAVVSLVLSVMALLKGSSIGKASGPRPPKPKKAKKDKKADKAAQ